MSLWLHGKQPVAVSVALHEYCKLRLKVRPSTSAKKLKNVGQFMQLKSKLLKKKIY